MKLKNKKTGKIVIVEFITDYQTDDGTEIGFRVKNTLNYYSYPSIAELSEEWEDYNPAEPLIKNEKIRKAVRAWADANGDSIIIVHLIDGKTTRLNGSFTGLNTEFDIMDELEDGKKYTITELCGENEQ